MKIGFEENQFWVGFCQLQQCSFRFEQFW